MFDYWWREVCWMWTCRGWSSQSKEPLNFYWVKIENSWLHVSHLIGRETCECLFDNEGVAFTHYSFFNLWDWQWINESHIYDKTSQVFRFDKNLVCIRLWCWLLLVLWWHCEAFKIGILKFQVKIWVLEKINFLIGILESLGMKR